MKNTFDTLRVLLRRTTCKPGWTFRLEDDDEGFRLVILAPCEDSRAAPTYVTDAELEMVQDIVGSTGRLSNAERCRIYERFRHHFRVPMRYIGINHYFPVPTTTWNEKSWRRWIFECCRKVEDHELGEWFLVGGERPFAPLHAPGCDPYTIREVSTEEEARTDQHGNVT